MQCGTRHDSVHDGAAVVRAKATLLSLCRLASRRDATAELTATTIHLSGLDSSAFRCSMRKGGERPLFPRAIHIPQRLQVLLARPGSRGPPPLGPPPPQWIIVNLRQLFSQCWALVPTFEHASAVPGVDCSRREEHRQQRRPEPADKTRTITSTARPVNQSAGDTASNIFQRWGLQTEGKLLLVSRKHPMYISSQFQEQGGARYPYFTYFLRIFNWKIW